MDTSYVVVLTILEHVATTSLESLILQFIDYGSEVDGFDFEWLTRIINENVAFRELESLTIRIDYRYGITPTMEDAAEVRMKGRVKGLRNGLLKFQSVCQ